MKLANCGCVYHAEEGIPCEHDIALNKANMKIKFNRKTTLWVCESYDEKKDHGEFTEFTWEEGQIVEVDILEDHGTAIDIQFGDGSVALGIEKCWIEVM